MLLQASFISGFSLTEKNEIPSCLGLLSRGSQGSPRPPPMAREFTATLLINILITMSAGRRLWRCYKSAAIAREHSNHSFDRTFKMRFILLLILVALPLNVVSAEIRIPRIKGLRMYMTPFSWTTTDLFVANKSRCRSQPCIAFFESGESFLLSVCFGNSYVDVFRGEKSIGAL